MHSQLGPLPSKLNSWEKSWHPGRCRTCVRIHSCTSALVLTSDIAPPKLLPLPDLRAGVPLSIHFVFEYPGNITSSQHRQDAGAAGTPRLRALEGPSISRPSVRRQIGLSFNPNGQL